MSGAYLGIAGSQYYIEVVFSHYYPVSIPRKRQQTAYSIFSQTMRSSYTYPVMLFMVEVGLKESMHHHQKT